MRTRGLACVTSAREGNLREETFPPTEEVRRLIAKIVGWIIVIAILVWIISNPEQAGRDVNDWITGIISFFQNAVGVH